MNIHLFDLKSEMVNRGITSLDFMENNFRVNYEDTKLTISKIFLVEDKHICRPDMVSFDAYGSVEYVDIILKFNHISNPFSMELYDLIVVPKLNTAIRFYKKDPLKTEKMLNDTKGLFVDPSRASKKDQERLKLLKEIAKKSKNGSSEIKPTNLLRDGEAPFTSNGDIIVFAPNSSAPRKVVNTNESLIKTNNSNI
jgi:hypothetical protein